MTFYSLGARNRYLGDSQTRCRNSCLTLKGHAGHLWLLSLSRSGFLRCMGGVGRPRQQGQPQVLLPFCSSGLRGSSGLLPGLGPSLFAVFGRRPLGHWHCFCFPQHHKSFAEARERLQSAPLLVFLAAFYLWIRQSCGGGRARPGGPSQLQQQRLRCGGGGQVRCTGCPCCRIMGIGMGWRPPSIKWARGRTREPVTCLAVALLKSPAGGGNQKVQTDHAHHRSSFLLILTL